MTLIDRDGRPRYQRSVRRGGRVTTEYITGGEEAVLLARLDALMRQERREEREAERAATASLKAREQPLIDYFEAVEDLIRVAMYAAGFHRPRRQWRKRRGKH